jgi:hypothetical protein
MWARMAAADLPSQDHRLIRWHEDHQRWLSDAPTVLL